MFDLSDRTQIEVTGADCATFLHNFCTNDVNRLSPGEGCEAFMTNVKGRILGHLFLFAEADAVWIDSVAGAEQGLIAHLDRYLITEDVQLIPRTAELGEFFVTGPHAEHALQVLQIDVSLEEANSHAATAAAKGIGPIRVRRVDWFAQPGFLISFPGEQQETLWERLSTTESIHVAGSLAFHALRIESGFPLYGIDISEDNLVQEVSRTSRAVSFTKGCYLGQEPIARIDAMGHVNRELCGLMLDHGVSPEPGASIVAGDDRNEVGRITSSVRLTEQSEPLALGYLRSRFTKPGSQVAVNIDGEFVPAVVFRPESS